MLALVYVLLNFGHWETMDRSMSAIMFLGLVQSNTVSPWTPGVITEGEAVIASNRWRNWVSDFSCQYACNTHQSVMIHTLLDGNEYSPFPICSGLNTLMAFIKENAILSPSMPSKPVVHEGWLLQLRTDIDTSSPKYNPLMGPVQVQDTTSKRILESWKNIEMN